MFRINNRVKIFNNKIVAYQNYSTPGIYKFFNVNINTTYKIYLEGYRGLSNTKLWIADIKNRKIYFEKINNTEITYHNNNYRLIKIGILFSGKFNIGDFYILNDIKLIEYNNNYSNKDYNNKDYSNKNYNNEDYSNLYYSEKKKFLNKECDIINEIKLFNNVLVKDKLIIQLCTSYDIKYFDPFAKRKYRLVPYYDKTKPVIFYGCYNDTDLRKIKNHTGHKVLIWGGTDIMDRRLRSSVFKIKNLKHIAQSSFIKKDLKKHNQQYIYLPFTPTISSNLYSPIRKGSCIYVYTNACNQEFYGSTIYYKLIKQFPKLNFIIATNVSSYYQAKQRGINCKYLQSFNPSDMYNVYNKCFIGLRLTKHDGISATVQELGMLGIKTIHNGKTPSCINYKSYNDIVRIIMKEMETIGEIDEITANSTKNHLQICDNLLPYLFKTVTVEGDIYVMINYNKWQSYNSYIKRKNDIWIMYNNSGKIIKRNDDMSSYVLPIDGWY